MSADLAPYYGLAERLRIHAENNAEERALLNRTAHAIEQLIGIVRITERQRQGWWDAHARVDRKLVAERRALVAAVGAAERWADTFPRLEVEEDSSHNGIDIRGWLHEALTPFKVLTLSALGTEPQDAAE